MNPQIPDPLEPPPEKPDDAPPRPAGKAAQWQAAGATAKSSGKGTALVVTVLLFAAVAGLLAWLLVIPTPPVDPYIVSVPVVEYKDPAVPPNPWAERDAELLTACFPEDAQNTRKNNQDRAQFRQKLDYVRQLADQWKRDNPGKTFDPERPFILHVCGHAAADSQGALCLLPSDAAAGNPGTWVKVEEILRAMDECPAVNKLLVLDLARPAANPFTGPLADDVAGRLEDLLAKYKSKDGADRLPCPVLTPCSRGEVALIVPDARVSAFAFYLAEGLRGAADGYAAGQPGERQKDGKVFLREVAEFLPARVQRWALQTHGVTQTPKLHDRGVKETDFHVRLTPEPIDDPAPGKLEYAGFDGPRRWQERDKLPPDAARPAGAELARWEAVLVRADQVYAATADGKSANDPIAAAAGLWGRVQQAAAAPAGPRYRSWLTAEPALTANPRPDPVTRLLAARDDYLREATRRSGKPDEKAVDERLTKLAEAGGEQPDLAGRAVWKWVLTEAGRPAGPDSPRGVFEAAARGVQRLRLTKLYTEAVLLQAVYATEDTRRVFRTDPRAEPVKVALLKAEDAAAAALLHGPDGFLWAQDLIEAADRARRAEEKRLFDPDRRGTGDDFPAAAEFDGVARRLDEAARQFADARERMQAVAHARAVSADALRVLSATALYTAEADATDVEADWHALADAALGLVRLAYQAPKTAAELPTTALRTEADKAAVLIPRLRDRWSPAEVKRRAEASQADPDRRLGRRLALDLTVPLLTATDRRQVWDAAQAAAARFHKSTREEQDKSENESNARTRPPQAVVPWPGDPARRARVALKMLDLAGYAGLDEAARAVDAARAAQTPAGWTAAAAALRQAWAEKLPRQVEDLHRKKEWDRAERAERAFPPGAWPDVTRAATGTVPAVARRAGEREAFRSWLRGHYGAYGTIRRNVPGAEKSYEEAAADLGPPGAN